MRKGVLIARKIGYRGWIAIGLCAAAAAAAPRLWSSRFVSKRRAAFALGNARASLAAGDLDRAREELRRALRFSPANADARAQLASVELARGDWELAFLEYQSLTELHPEDATGWIGLAGVMVKAGLLGAPEAALDKAISIAPERADARLLRGDLRFRVGRYRGALLDAQAAGTDPALLARSTARSAGEKARPGVARDLGPDPVPAARFRAEARSGHAGLAALGQEHWPGRLAQMRQALEARMRQQDWAGAQGVVAAARRAYPDSSFPAFLAGILEMARGNLDTAEGHLTAALDLSPRSAVVTTALAKAWARQHGVAGAGERLMRLAEHDPGFGFARYLAARAYMDGRDPLQAEAAIRRGFALQPDSPIPYQQVAAYYLDLDRAPDVLGVCAQGLERFPRDEELALTLGQVSVDLGRIRDAIHVYDELLSRRPDLDLVEYRLAALVARDDKDEAMAQRAQAIAKRLGNDLPSDPLLLDALGWVHFRAGLTDRARALLEMAVKGAPDEPAPHYHLAAAYARQKRLDLAGGELKAALDSDRPFPERLEAMRLSRDTALRSARQ